MGVDDERRDYDRRASDQELALWRGGIEARVTALELQQAQLVTTTAGIDRTVTRMDARQENFRLELTASREEVRAAAKQIDKGRDDAVAKLEQAIADRDENASAWKLTKFQVFVGGIVAIIVASVPTLLTLAIAGVLH